MLINGKKMVFILVIVMCGKAYIFPTKCPTAKLTAEILVKKSSGFEDEGVTGLVVNKL